MPENPAVLVRIQQVDRTFTSGDVAVRVLRGVDLDILAGQLLVIVGPSGSGKTTLLNLIGGLDQPTQGRVLFRGRDLAQLTARQLAAYRRESVGFVFQFYNLIPNLTARENVQLAAEMGDDPLDVDETLRLMGLGERMEHFPAQLSGGEQQRVALARALAKNPDLLLCDEPTGALDFKTGKLVLGLLRETCRNFGKTVVIITHNTAISEMADKTLRMRSGEIVEAHDNPTPLDPGELVW